MAAAPKTSNIEYPTFNIYVSREGSGDIIKFTITAGVLASTSSVFSTAGLVNPNDVAFDNAGNLYLVDRGANDVFKYASIDGYPNIIFPGLIPTALSFAGLFALRVWSRSTFDRTPPRPA